MINYWCPKCGEYVSDKAGGCTCGGKPVPIGVTMNTDSHGAASEETREGGDPVRDGDDSLEGPLPGGLSAEHADALVRSGEEALKNGRNRGQEALRVEIESVINRLSKEFRLTYVDVTGVLRHIAHDWMHEARDGDDDEGDEWKKGTRV
jgi:hypothetical protein